MFNNVKIDELPDAIKPAVERLSEISRTAALPTIYDFISDPEHARHLNEMYGNYSGRNEEATIRDFIKAANYDRGRINEPQYQTRLREAGEDKNRRSLTAMQYALRAKLLNTVLEYHQKLADLDELLKEADELIAVVMKNLDLLEGEPRNFLLSACVEIAALAREVRHNLAICLKYVDGVNGLDWYACYEAMQEIFRDEALTNPTFGARAYDFSFLELARPEVGLEADLKAAVLSVQEAFWGRRHSVQRFISAKSSVNRRQYQSRLDNASVLGETENFDRIVEEQKLKEAELYRAAHGVRYWQDELDQRADALTTILREAFKRVAAECSEFDFEQMRRIEPGQMAEKLPRSIQLHVAMNNCIAAKKWLVEARDKIGIDGQFDPEIEKVAAEYDPEAFLRESMAK